MNVLARLGLGGVAGFAATYVMDAVTEIIYTEDIKRREQAIQQQSAAQALARRILDRLDLHPSDEDVTRIAPLLHWSFGISCGLAAGVLARRNGVIASVSVTASMLAFDEFGLSLLGAAPPSTRYPWQTHVRSIAGHAAYAFTLAVLYETLTSAIHSDRTTDSLAR